MPLTDAAIKAAKPGPKRVRLFDARGLYLEVSPRGGKWWRLKYRLDGKERRFSLGVYPDVTLAAARDKREDARKLVAAGIDPSVHRQAAKRAKADRAGNSFEVVAREWYLLHRPEWAAKHAERVLARLEHDVFPAIGARPVADVSAPEVLAIVRRIEGRDAVVTANRVRGICGQVFRYAVATGRAASDPSRDLRGAVKPTSIAHFAAVTDPTEVGGLLRAIRDYKGTAVVAAALKLAPLVFVRPGELRRAQWADIDLDAAEWRFVVTKTDTPHIVPLSTQAVAILRDLHALTGTGPYVFPSARTSHRPMSDNAVLAALRRLGIPKEEMTGHGFRATARTLLDEGLKVRPELIEHQLAHMVRDPLGRAYNRTAHLAERRKMMQDWADYLDRLEAGSRARVLPFGGERA